MCLLPPCADLKDSVNHRRQQWRKGNVILNILGNSYVGSWHTQTGCLDLNLFSYGRFCAVLSPLTAQHVLWIYRAAHPDSQSWFCFLLWPFLSHLLLISNRLVLLRALRWIPSFAGRKVSLLSNPRGACFPINYWLVPMPGGACNSKMF